MVTDKANGALQKKGARTSRSVLPNLRSQNGTLENRSTFADKVRDKSVQQVTIIDAKDESNLRNKTPAQRRAAEGGRGGGFGFPSLISSANQNSKEMYSINYVLDIDRQMYNTRQNSKHIGNFYHRLINNRIMNLEKPTPLLAAETTIMSNSVTNRDSISKAKGGMGHLQGVRRHANLSRTIQDELEPNRHMNDNSGLDQYAMIREHDEEQQTLLPSIAHLQSDDSLFGDSKAEYQPQSKIKFGVSHITNILNQTEMTQPQTSKHTNDQTALQLTIAESILRQSQLMDPLAGNSIISQLNTSMRINAKDKISGVFQKSARKRSQQRRRLELVGEKELKRQPGDGPNQFTHRGALEEVMSNSSAMVTQTESIADSSIYKELADDMDGYVKFIEKDQLMELQLGNTQKSLKGQAQGLAQNSLQQQIDTKMEEAEEMRALRSNPQAHFNSLKAKIKLKVIKKYQEDLQKKEDMKNQALEPVIIVKDKFGRIMEKKGPLVSNGKKVSKSRLPIKREPPKRKLSFTESQMKYYGAKDIFNPMQDIQKPTLTDKYIIDFMKVTDRYPISEALVGRQPKKSYELEIDSLISKCYNLDAVIAWGEVEPFQGGQAPNNSMESEEEFHVYESQESDDENAVPYITKQKLKANPELELKKFNMLILETSGYRLESMRYFPYRTREGTIPLKLLQRPKLDWLFDTVQPRLMDQQKAKKIDPNTIQNMFEYYCQECKAAPITLKGFYNREDPNNTKLSFRNYQLDDQTVKALALILPFIHDINELELNNNQMTDQVASALAISFFMNPYLRRITIAYNFIRNTFCKTLAKLATIQPERITDINLMGSISFPDHIDPIIQALPTLKYLTSLNIAGCSLTQASCRQLSKFVFTCFTLRVLDVSHCRISYQGTRYLIDALNRNTCIRNFNFSHNDLNSSSYEFSIKVASMLTRHPCLMHLDITNCNLKREEIMFIGLAINQSKTLLSIHLTAQKIPYYERIFLRSILAARVGFKKHNEAMKKDINTNKEKNQLLQMASGDVQEPLLHHYIDNLKDLDEKRQHLDFEIQDLLAEMDTQASFENVNPDDKLEDLAPEQSKIQELVKKMVERQQEFEAQQAELQKLYDQERTAVAQEMQKIEGLQNFGQELFDEFGSPEKQQGIRQPVMEEDNFQKMRELRVERHKQRAEMEVIKENKDRSAGELALMFMGINQVAYDLLVENPMTGYMNEIIFSRVLGHSEIEEGDFWVDTTQCWICYKHNKVTIGYSLKDDKEIFKQRVTQIDQLQNKISSAVEEALLKNKLQAQAAEIEVVNMDDGKSVDSFVQDNDQSPGKSKRKRKDKKLSMTGIDNKNYLRDAAPGHTYGSKDPIKQDRTISDGGITQILKETQPHRHAFENRQDQLLQQYQHNIEHNSTEQFVDEANLGLNRTGQATSESQLVIKPYATENDTTNQLSPVKTTKNILKKMIYPDQYDGVSKISYQMKSTEDMYGENLINLQKLQLELEEVQEKFNGPSENKNKIKVMPLRTQNTYAFDKRNSKTNALHLQRHYMGSKGGSSMGGDVNMGLHSTVISSFEQKKRKRGDPVIIQRQIFFEGVVYQIEEELYSDSDHSSVYTSEDSWDVDKTIQSRFRQANPLVSEHQSNISQSQQLQSGNLLKKFTADQTPKGTAGADRKKSGKVIQAVIEEEEENKTPTTGALTATNPKSPLTATDQLKSPLKLNKEKAAAAEPKTPSRRESVKRKVSIAEDSKNGDSTPAQKNSKDLTSSLPTTVDKKAADQDRKASVKKAPQNKKSYSKDKQALHKEFFTNSENMTPAQLMYEPKVGAKHFKPQLMEKRMKHFEDTYEHPSFKQTGNLSKLNSFKDNSPIASLQGREGSLLKNDTFKPETSKDVYCVATFSDWMPMRMKTLRKLNMERFPMDTPEEEVQEARTYLLDNQVVLCAQMVPPGFHYFYFVKDKGTIFLSPNYEVVRFKSTNIFMNRIFVTKRLEDVETVHVAKAGDEEEAVFMKDRSVFKEYREDTQTFLKKCFDEDFQFGKIPRLIKKGSDFDEKLQLVKDVLFEHYVRIINIFDNLSGTSSYPTFNMMDFTEFARKCKIYDNDTMKMADLDLILTATCVSTHQFVNSASLDMQRYEFLEMLCRVADHQIKQNKSKKLHEVVDQVLEKNVYPNQATMDGEHFRRYQCYAVKVNEILKKNESQIQRVYASFTHNKKRYITCEECQEFVKKVGLKISVMYVGAIYAESMMTIIDPVRDPIRPNQMKYVEFLVFLCRISFEHYRKTPYHKELLYLKLDHLMPAYLAYGNMQPNFLFAEKFQSEVAEEKLKAKKRKQKIKRAMLRAKQGGSEVDPRLLAEEKAYQDALAKTGMGGFQASQMAGKVIQDSDSDLGESSDDNAQFNIRGTPLQQAQEGGEQPTGSQDADEEDLQNADLESVVSGTQAAAGVIIPVPEREETNQASALEAEVAVVPEEAAGEDEDADEGGPAAEQTPSQK